MNIASKLFFIRSVSLSFKWGFSATSQMGTVADHTLSHPRKTNNFANEEGKHAKPAQSAIERGKNPNSYNSEIRMTFFHYVLTGKPEANMIE